MNLKRKKVLDKLDELKIEYELVEHPAVKTMEEMAALGIDNPDEVVKNLFLCDDKKSRYFLVSVPGDKTINLKDLRDKLSSRPLSFASESRLNIVLGLDRGEVTPLGILNDDEKRVEVIFDKEIRNYKRIGIHPNDNTATIFLSLADLERVIKEHGNSITYMGD